MPSAKQKKINTKFSRCGNYASKAITDPELSKLYDEFSDCDQPSYYLAFLDAMNAPEVLFIDTGEYNGKIGNPIMVEAIDNFQVKDVRIEIFSKSGGLIEQGFAVQQKCTLYWKYKATKENPWVTGTRIVATAIDLPGNEQSMEIFI